MASHISTQSASNLPSLRLSFLPQSEEFWQSLPSSPGIYIFEDKDKNPLYIGKSISLKSRLRQHYEGFVTGTTKAANFIPQTHTLFLKIVNNDLEAIILEANYIRSHKPRYNAISKDGKSNTYIVITNYPDSKIKIIHATDITSLDLDDYRKQIFGPFTSAKTAEILLKEVRRIFGYCNDPFNSRNRACFNYHLEHCPGACLWLITPSQYRLHLRQIRRFLSGRFTELQKSLYRQIKSAVKKEKYEQASLVKKQLENLEQAMNNKRSSLLLKLSDTTEQIQSLIIETLKHPQLKKIPHRLECYDLAHLQGENYVGSMSVFIDGRPQTNLYRHFHIQGQERSDPGGLKQIIGRRLKHREWPLPDLIILDGGVPQLSIVSSSVPASIAVIALAKKNETIYFYNQENKIVSLNLNLEDPVLNLFRNIRDEAHRFATTFHKQQRQKSLVSNILKS